MFRAAVVRMLVGSAVVTAVAGCQTFIGVEDAEAHLPRLDGTYLMTISRVRVNGGQTDKIRTRTLASLDAEARTLDLSFVILGDGGDTAVAEGSITGIEFPADGTAAVFAFNVQVPSAAVAMPAPTGVDQVIDVPEMLLRAEADYSFCAVPANGSQRTPTVGTLMVAAGAALPPAARADVDCDEPVE